MKITQLPTKENPIINNEGKIWVDEDIIYWDATNVKATKESARKDIEIGKGIIKLLKKPIKLLIFMGNGRVDKDARELYTQITFVDKIALVITTTTAKIIAQFFVGMNKYNRPLSIFSNEKEALAWLRSDN